MAEDWRLLTGRNSSGLASAAVTVPQLGAAASTAAVWKAAVPVGVAPAAAASGMDTTRDTDCPTAGGAAPRPPAHRRWVRRPVA